jgi:hypothetical protein
MPQRGVLPQDSPGGFGDRDAVRPKDPPVDEIVRLFGHAAGGRVSERLLSGLGVHVAALPFSVACMARPAILCEETSTRDCERRLELAEGVRLWNYRRGYRAP